MSKLISLTPKEFAECLVVLLNNVKTDSSKNYKASIWLGKAGEVRIYVKNDSYVNCGYIIIKYSGEVLIKVVPYLTSLIKLQVDTLQSKYRIGDNITHELAKDLNLSMCFNCQQRVAQCNGLCSRCND